MSRTVKLSGIPSPQTFERRLSGLQTLERWINANRPPDYWNRYGSVKAREWRTMRQAISALLKETGENLTFAKNYAKVNADAANV